MDDSRNNDTPDERPEDAKVTERRKDFTRRALVRAGWLTPIVTAVNIPSAFAQSPAPPHTDHSDHTDLPHTDTPHSDAPHTDAPHTDHSDTPHQDHQDHADSHFDSHADSHVDAHVDVHSDVHSDVPHVDAF